MKIAVSMHTPLICNKDSGDNAHVTLLSNEDSSINAYIPLLSYDDSSVNARINLLSNMKITVSMNTFLHYLMNRGVRTNLKVVLPKGGGVWGRPQRGSSGC